METFSLIKEKLSQSISYNEYFEIFRMKAESNDLSLLSDFEKENINYIKLNFQRSNRIHKSYKVSEDLTPLIKKISVDQFWILITEEWCGDSAQTVPFIYEMTKLNPKINFKIFKRDSNLELMDLYLTNGSRSIPKLIVFDNFGNELFTWGPRPKEAQELISKLKQEGKSKDEFIEQLHLWYGRNRGKNLEKEFMELIKNTI